MIRHFDKCLADELVSAGCTVSSAHDGVILPRGLYLGYVRTMYVPYHRPDYYRIHLRPRDRRRSGRDVPVGTLADVYAWLHGDEGGG